MYVILIDIAPEVTNVFLHFQILSSFCCLFCCPLLYLLDYWFALLFYSFLNHSSVFFSVQLWLSCGTFLYFMSLCWSSDCVHSFFSLNRWNYFFPQTLLWTLYKVSCLSLFIKVFFSWGFALFFDLKHLHLHLACLSVFVCMYR